MRHVIAGVLLLTAGLAGCLDVAEPEATEPASEASASRGTQPTVVAVPDSGFNPYHEAFQGGPTFAEVPGFPDGAEAIEPTRGVDSYDAALAADGEAWEGVEEGELVWFPGTRLAGISFGAEVAASSPTGEAVSDPPAPILDVNGHGTLTSHAAIAASPNTVVLGVQVPDDEQLAPALEWIAEQGWIDLVSVSWGNWAWEYAQGEVLMGLQEAYRAAYDSGKLVLNAAGNTPQPHHEQEHSGPPFVVSVGGSEDDTKGETGIAAKLPDVVAPFTQERAEAETLDGYRTASGTSLSTPLAAGSVAEALWMVRDARGAEIPGDASALALADGEGAFDDGELTKEELWHAMNASAVQWGATDWQPEPDPGGSGLPVLHPAVQMGWGQVTPDVSAPMADLLLGEREAADKAPGTDEIMQAGDDAARAIWGSPGDGAGLAATG